MKSRPKAGMQQETKRVRQKKVPSRRNNVAMAAFTPRPAAEPFAGERKMRIGLKPGVHREGPGKRGP
jgi:hypothetical protein